MSVGRAWRRLRRFGRLGGLLRVKRDGEAGDNERRNG